MVPRKKASRFFESGKQVRQTYGEIMIKPSKAPWREVIARHVRSSISPAANVSTNMLQDISGGNMHATSSTYLLLAPQEHRVRGLPKDTEAESEPCERSRCVTYPRVSLREIPKDRANHSELTEDSASRSRDSFLWLKSSRKRHKICWVVPARWTAYELLLANKLPPSVVTFQKYKNINYW